MEKRKNLANSKRRIIMAASINGVISGVVNYFYGIPTVPEMAFGKAKWEKYFGDIGKEPSLPANIEEILNGDCPFWPEKKVRETHLLVLIPQTVNGNALTLNTLQKIIQEPSAGKSSKYSRNLLSEIGDRLELDHWILMTKDVIPGSRNQTYDQQKKLVEKYEYYELLGSLEAAVAILTHYVENEEFLYPWDNEKRTVTRCREKLNGGFISSIGAFNTGGLDVSYTDREHENYGIGCKMRLT